MKPITRGALALSSIALTALTLSCFATAPAADQTTLKPDDKLTAVKSVRLILPAQPGSEIRAVSFEDVTPDGLLKARAELAFRRLQVSVCSLVMHGKGESTVSNLQNPQRMGK